MALSRSQAYLYPVSPEKVNFMAWENKVRDYRHGQRGIQPDAWRKARQPRCWLGFLGLDTPQL